LEIEFEIVDDIDHVSSVTEVVVKKRNENIDPYDK